MMRFLACLALLPACADASLVRLVDPSCWNLPIGWHYVRQNSPGAPVSGAPIRSGAVFELMPCESRRCNQTLSKALTFADVVQPLQCHYALLGAAFQHKKVAWAEFGEEAWFLVSRGIGSWFSHYKSSFNVIHVLAVLALECG